MAGDAHGNKTQEEPQAAQNDGQQQATQDKPKVSGKDWEKALAERDGRIAELEQQVADAAKNAETADQLRNQIAELKAQGERVCAMAHTFSYVPSTVMCRGRQRRCPWRWTRHITNRLLP